MLLVVLAACGGSGHSSAPATTVAPTSSSTVPSFLKEATCAKWHQVVLTDRPILVRAEAVAAASAADRWEAAGGPKGVAAAMRMVGEGVFSDTEPPGFRDAYAFANRACS